MNEIAFWDMTWNALLALGVLIVGCLAGGYWLTRDYNRRDQ